MQTLRSLGTVRLAAMGAVALGLVIFFVFLSQRLSTPDNALLFADLDPSESAKIVGKLETMNIPYELRADGRQILVPQDHVLRLRMAMAEDGLPSGGTVGYELFDKSDTLGTTSFVQKINLVRALEGELARTIRSISTVDEARVHLVIPQRELFSRRERPPTASVLIRPKGADRLTKGQVAAIQHLVASRSPVSTRRACRSSTARATCSRAATARRKAPAALDSNEDLRRAYEDRMSRTIEELVEQSVGIGKVRAEVTADMDFDRVTTNTEKYDPDGQVVRSTQTVEENSDSTDTRNRPSVSVKNNLPNGQTDSTSPNNQSLDKSSRNEETVNYEISKTVQNHVRETGKVRRLSVAVLVDGTYTHDKAGKPVYQPRTAEEMAKLTKLVQSAIGYDAKRGDTLELINMQFAAGPQEPEKIEPPLVRPDQGRLFPHRRAAGARRRRHPGAAAGRAPAGQPHARRAADRAVARPRGEAPGQPVRSTSPALTGPGGTGVAQPEEDDMIDIAQVDGRVRASTIKKISEIVEHHPEETVAIIREWLYQDV